MSSRDRLASAAAFARRLREQTCTTPGHQDRHASWLIPRDVPNTGERWVCTDCRDAAR